MNLLFVHGWGFDATFWSGVEAHLPGWSGAKADRGYFGAPHEPVPRVPFVAVTHSFGALRILRDPPPGCRGLVAINGFDRFVAGSGGAGVASRVVERMIAGFDEDARAVVSQFRERCGHGAPFGALAREVLREDLVALRDGDARAGAARFARPILSLQGGADPILPAGLRETCFASAPSVARTTRPAAGHLLPLEEPALCAARIRAFASRCQ